MRFLREGSNAEMAKEDASCVVWTRRQVLMQERVRTCGKDRQCLWISTGLAQGPASRQRTLLCLSRLAPSISLLPSDKWFSSMKPAPNARPVTPSHTHRPTIGQQSTEVTQADRQIIRQFFPQSHRPPTSASTGCVHQQIAPVWNHRKNIFSSLDGNSLWA